MGVDPVAFAQAARTFVGVPFRLHGRDPCSALDCVGLVVAAFAKAGGAATVPTGYQLRNLRIGAFLPALEETGFREVAAAPETGDLLLVRPSAGQFHLMIVVPQGQLVHAHAGLGRVVETPGPLAWRIERQWRLPAN